MLFSINILQKQSFIQLNDNHIGILYSFIKLTSTVFSSNVFSNAQQQEQEQHPCLLITANLSWNSIIYFYLLRKCNVWLANEIEAKVFPIVHYCPNTMLSTSFHLEHERERERDWRKRAINETEKSLFLQPLNLSHLQKNFQRLYIFYKVGLFG